MLNPYSDSWLLQCPLFQLTGLQCPLCGSQRAVYELFHLNIGAAWELNPALFFVLPYLLILVLGQVFPRLRKRNPLVRLCYDDWTIVAVLILLLLWGIARNVL